MHSELPKFLVPFVYLIPALIAFYVGFELRKRIGRPVSGTSYLKMLYYLCLAEGVHNTYYFIATLFRNFNAQIYENLMMPVPWLMAQGIIAVTFVAFGVYFLKERNIELGDIRAEQETAKRYRELATFDSLTGLRNRRTFAELLEQERRRGLRTQRPLTLAMLDLDGFKEFNDTQGHQEGDKMLITVAGHIQSGLRQEIDIPFRYGGDEFFIILPETDAQQAYAIAERMKNGIKSASEGRITLSIGLLEITPRSLLKPDELVQCADKAMYTAKKGGGDRIFSFSHPESAG
jgi:diguanylate cyclase (GGDEF)-like protein